jgi:collagenase-like PrtC family protease
VPLLLKESKREYPFIVYEDIHGKYNFTAYNLNLLTKLDELYQAKIDTIRIDSFLHNES